MMFRRSLAVLAILLASAACTTVVVDSPPPAVGAQLSVERFLQAANERDVVAMGRIFGTEDGAAMDTGSTMGCAFKKMGSLFGGSSCVSKQEVEIRMDAIASILQHEDYQVVDESNVAGRTAPARRVLVNMTTADGVSVAEVPFVVVQDGNGRWLVEQVDLQRVMAAR
ncbi:MAG: hypothetical protein AAF389_12670 [Gemmatimonadota bacterium]